MIDQFVPEAIDEVVQAVNFLNAQVKGLGNAFYEAVDSAIALIKEHPTQWPVVVGEVRRYRLKRFKYHVVYQVHGDVLLIIAVSHTSRRSGYWLDRLR